MTEDKPTGAGALLNEAVDGDTLERLIWWLESSLAKCKESDWLGVTPKQVRMILAAMRKEGGEAVVAEPQQVSIEYFKAIFLEGYAAGFEDGESPFNARGERRWNERASTPELPNVGEQVLAALRFYADTSKYKAPYTGGMGELYFDCGDKAKQAIAALNTDEKGK